MAHAKISKAEESSHKQIKNEDNGQIFFYSHGVVNKEFVPPGVTLNQKYYREVLDCLRKRMLRFRMEIADDWILRASSRQRARKQSTVIS
jgi:hypothetical protein